MSIRSRFRAKVIDRTYDDAEWFDAGDSPVDWDRVQEVADLFDRAASPLEALRSLYGDDLEVPK